MSRAVRTLLVIAAIVVGAVAPAAAQDVAAITADFRRWLEDVVWPEARAAGVSRDTFDTAFAGMTPDLSLPELVLPGATDPLPVNQPEFRQPEAYFDAVNLTTLAHLGRENRDRWRETLTAIEARYGVPPEIILAIWGRESAFGRAALPHDAIRALATHAFTGRRQSFFRPELVAGLVLLERGLVERSAMRSSWAGAIGQMQLLPGAFARYAVDFDGDGRFDMSNSVPDILATIANHLSRDGWDRTRGWGVEVVLPPTASCIQEGPDRPLPLSEWQRQGVRMADGTAFTRSGATIYHLLVPAGRYGPAFLVTPNFYVIKKYNQSDLYALFVGQVADRIAGLPGGYATPWRLPVPFTHLDIRAIQGGLVPLGHDVGGVDGIMGYHTRRSIGAWQAANGHPVTCYPDAPVLAAFR